ncbi:hypothetical protein ABIB40_002991 [Pedobacter sp. UYP30]|uniref:hypothetical protein n=1 Tax=Pedobacter sp. UYP30 TaxID=1756400 RepID=UPI0033950DA5
MKSILLSAALLCALGLGCYAQTEKGNSMVGGSFSYSSDKLQSYGRRTNNFYLAPRYGYFLKNNLAIGLELPFNLSRLNFKSYQTYNNETGYFENNSAPKELSIGFSPFLRKYFITQSKIGFFAQANLLMLVNSFNVIEDGYLLRTDVQVKGLGANLSAGLSLNVSANTKIEFSLPFASFFHQSYYDEHSEYNYDKKNNFNVFPNILTPTLGVNVYF